MARQLNIAGKNSDDIYTIFYPNNLMNFCRYDFSAFLEHCTDMCRLAARTGEFNVDDVYAVRNSISGCHRYFEQNIRTTFDKIVIDCWIDYLCKQSGVSVNALWQSFMKCRNSFEKAIFSRLSDYRYNRAINEWVDLMRLQEYAQVKADFVFGVNITSPQQAVSRATYFDLLFNVAANEQGFPISEIASVGVFTAGRLPNSPFVMGSAAREIARNQLKDIEFKENYKSRKNPNLSDKTAMDAFAAVKKFIPDKNDSMAKTIIKSLTAAPQQIYVPGSFKAIIDLEIDISAASGAYIQRCARCGDYYIRDEDYNFDYCSRVQSVGGTCLEIMKVDEPELAEAIAAAAERAEQDEDRDEPKIIYIDKETVNAKMDSLYKEMAARVNVDLTQRDFSVWYQKELHLKDEILLGKAGEKELDEFIRLSRGSEFSSKKQPLTEYKAGSISDDGQTDENGKQIKRFVFEKVDRNSATVSPAPSTLAESEKAAMDAVRRLFEADRSRTSDSGRQTSAASSVIKQQNMAYDPAGVQNYGYPSQYSQSAYTMPQASYQQTTFPDTGAYRGYYQPPPRTQGLPRIIKGGTAMAQEYVPRTGTVVIPNGNDNRTPVMVPGNTQPRPAAEKIDKAVQNPADPEKNEAADNDVKVFTPRKNNIFRNKQSDGYIEPSPYEKMRQAIEERAEQKTEEDKTEVDGQMSAEDVIRPVSPVTANAVAAYKGINFSEKAETETSEAEKADFSRILEGITREDGFSKEENLVDSDGLPVSHKTKHVMNALFGPSKASPILRVRLDDDDDDN